MNTSQNNSECPVCSGEHEEKTELQRSNEKIKTAHTTGHHSHIQESTLKYHLDKLKNKIDYFSGEEISKTQVIF